VTSIRPGTAIELSTINASEGSRYVVQVTDADLTVLNLSHPTLPEDAAKQLRRIAAKNPSALLRVRQNAVLDEGEMRLGPYGLFYAGQKVVDTASLVVTIPRADVLSVSRFVSRGSGWGALAGGAAGFLLGTHLGMTLAFKQCGSSCSDEQFLMMLSFIGVPIGTGILGYHVARHSVDVVGYRAAPVRRLPARGSGFVITIR
jgi:hypothetical protein